MWVVVNLTKNKTDCSISSKEPQFDGYNPQYDPFILGLSDVHRDNDLGSAVRGPVRRLMVGLPINLFPTLLNTFMRQSRGMR